VVEMYETHSLVCVFVVLITVECVFPVREDWILFFSFFSLIEGLVSFC